MKSIPFVKMHGLGNDYVYMEEKDCAGISFDTSVPEMCDRHTGIGADGLVLYSSNDGFRMRIFNSDGSEAEMCGNACRCLARLFHDRCLLGGRLTFGLHTRAGIRRITVSENPDGTFREASVSMGRYSVTPLPDRPADIPDGIAIDMGNPHYVVFTQDIERVRELGRRIGTSPIFPSGANVEFARPAGPQSIEMRVWERGSGITRACGTGACAAAAAAQLLKKIDRGDTVVEMEGGRLVISVSPDGEVTMTGPAEMVYEGVYRF